MYWNIAFLSNLKHKNTVKKQKNAVDSAIEQVYYARAQGLQIGMMDIPKLFNDARLAISQGKDVESATVEAIAKYCQPA